MEGQIKTIQIDGLVFLKIIKHYQDEIVRPQDVVSGVLLGLSENEILQVTHSFPIPKLPEETESNDNSTYAYLINMYPSFIYLFRQNMPVSSVFLPPLIPETPGAQLRNTMTALHPLSHHQIQNVFTDNCFR